MADFFNKTKRWIRASKLMFKDPRFWMTQGAVGAIAIAHELLEDFSRLTGDPIDFLPISFFWVPLVYMAVNFGSFGALLTSSLVILFSAVNWANMQNSERRWEEIMIVAIAAIVSLLVGWQVDRRVETQREARAYAENAVHSQEEERRQLSLDLHDDSIQALISVCHELDSLKNTSLPSQRSLLDIRSSVAGVVQKLRDISVALHPPVLDDMGVVSALRSLISKSASKAGFDCELNIVGKPHRLSPDAELAIFRIVQEALRNVERHAKATRVSVDITFAVKEVALEVVDNGIGFDVTALPARIGRNHLGLLSMKERAEMLGGKFRISSRSGQGTRVAAHIPLASSSS